MISLTIWLIIPLIAQSTAQLKRTLVWSDDFDGDKLDETKWTYALGTGNGGWGNGEFQYYTNKNDNVFLQNGLLVLQALQEDYKGSNYTSGRIFTKNKVDILYGRIEARARLPIGQGLWPAFWMLPTNYTHGPGIASGEIDIMEYLGHRPDVVYHTAHYGHNWTDRGKMTKGAWLPKGQTYHDNFHVFAVEWRPGSLDFFVDKKKTMHFGKADVPAKYVYPYDIPFYILLNVAIGGDWPGPPDMSTKFPQRMEVDYVRLYQL